ncbi:MAG TPA: thiamine pyrophosphate-binding protein [Jatrophihabitans sp.]|nr:thiamine pyrophosphate-binding protein [Jatrophihabitans sp.]
MNQRDTEPAGTMTVPTGLDWQAALAEAFIANEISVVSFVPDSRLHGLLEQLEAAEIPLRSLAREEECVAYAAGQRLAGKRPLVVFQSSGLGNSLNALATLAVPSRLGLPIVISMRGSLGEGNPSQLPIGRAVEPILADIGIPSFTMREAAQGAALVDGVCSLAFKARECAAILLAPELGGGRETR